MLNVKYLLEVLGFVLMAAAAALLLHDLYRLYQQSDMILQQQPHLAEVRLSQRAAIAITTLAVTTLLAGISLQQVPAGHAGVRVSEISGQLPGTLAPGMHLVIPFVQSVELSPQ